MDLPGELDDWQVYRNYLQVLARQALSQSIREKVDESDVVQEALLRGYRNRDEFRGRSEAEFLAWLRCILERQVYDAYRKYHRGKRDVSREQEIHRLVEQSSAWIEESITARQPAPSDEAIRNERRLSIASLLQQLPSRQREAVELKYLQGLSFSEVATRMGLSRDQVAGLVRRGVQRLRELKLTPD